MEPTNSLADEIKKTKDLTESLVGDIGNYYIPYITALSDLFFDLIREVRDPATQQKFLLRLRAIDKNLRAMYHGPKVEQAHNEQGTETPAVATDSTTNTGRA